jgi:hypothetical protein
VRMLQFLMEHRGLRAADLTPSSARAPSPPWFSMANGNSARATSANSPSSSTSPPLYSWGSDPNYVPCPAMVTRSRLLRA